MIQTNTNLENNIDNLFDNFDKLNNVNAINSYISIQQTLLNTYPNEIHTMLPYFSEDLLFLESIVCIVIS
jgi:hypothetical protein